MKRTLSTLATAAILGTAVLPLAGRAQAAQLRAASHVSVVAVTPTAVTAKHATVAFRLKVTGLTMDVANMGKKNVAGHGHIQLYVDKVPKDAYTRKDLKHDWLASLANPVFSLKLSPAILGGTGKHHIIIALAQNNYVLYHVPTVSVTITANK